MKRASLIVLALALMFAAACNGGSNTNKNAANENKNINSNLNTTGGQGITGEADPAVLSIAVVVCYDASRNVVARVTEPIYASSKIPQKVRWCVYNDLDIALTSVSISAFNSGASAGAVLCSNAPNLTTGNIAPGNLDAACTEFCAVAPSAPGTSFQYTVTARPYNQSDVNILGPRVIIQ